MAEHNETECNGRQIIAYWVLGFSGAVLVALTWLILHYTAQCNTAKFPEVSDKLFTALLPLLGTWVGTVLTFYFTRENFESASKSVRDMAKQMTADEKLRGIPVKEKHIPLAEMSKKQGKPDQIMLKADILDYLDVQGRNRLPILDERGCPLYVVHRSMVDKFLASGLLTGALTVDTVPAKTLQDLLNDSEAQKMLANSFALVAEEASLSEAKIAMERMPDCRDVFVTRTGRRDEPVLGWLTNIIISEAAKV